MLSKLTTLTALSLLVACSNAPTRPAPAASSAPPPAAAAPHVDTVVSTSGTQAPPAPATPALPNEVKTRNALFKASAFSDLPGWASDDLLGAWDAMRGSCKALDRRESWRSLCLAFDKLPRRTPDVRRFFEAQFALFQILNTDASRDGDVTGYYEPMIAGSTRPEGSFTLPVYGPPNDLYSIDWKSIPPAQRRGVVQVVPEGRELVVVPSARPNSVALDASQFELDTRDRRWRVRIDGKLAKPYMTRSEIDALPRLDAPVIAWVDDALALYAMQVQGSGRIQLRDGRVLRVQYAEQNGHPFKPLRLAPRAGQKLATRGLAGNTTEPERFDLLDAAPGADDGVEDRATTRGIKPAGSSSSSEKAPSRSASLVDELLGSAKPSPAATQRTASTTKKSNDTAPARPPNAQVGNALRSDPSYVFFRIAPDQSPAQGPLGALGVPLTPGRSIAVDPRVTPMGYPVYMAAPTPAGVSVPLQRLVVAQDTGGAIRGAIRADFFWGFGHDAGRQALRTRERGQMWLLLPRGEAATLLSGSLATRGLGSRAVRSSGECLVPDGEFCTEAE